MRKLCTVRIAIYLDSFSESRRVELTDQPAQVVSVGRGYQGMGRHQHHDHHDHHGAEMYGYHQSHNASTDNNRLLW